MQRRLLVIALVFVVGFGVGYGITWLLVGSSARDPGAERQARAPEPTRLASDARPTPASIPAPGQDVAVAAPDVAHAVPDVATPTPDAVAAAATETGPSAGAEVAAAPVADSEPAPKAAWEVCHMHACRVDFGKITGGISIRKGSLEHGQTVDWDKDFAKADKIGTLDSGPRVKVEVLAIGLKNGEPTAAYVIRKTKRDELKGVIALRIGDKSLRLVPLDE